MSRAPRQAAGESWRCSLVLGIAVAVGACSGCSNQTQDEVSYTAKPRAPYTSDSYSSTRLILERTDSGFEVLSSAPSFGGVTLPDVADAVPDLLAGKEQLYAYAVRSLDGGSVAQGYFLMSLEARATYADEDHPDRIHHAELDDPSSVVRVAIPFVPNGATVEIRALTPDADRPYTEWSQASAASIRIEPAPVEQRPRDASP